MMMRRTLFAAALLAMLPITAFADKVVKTGTFAKDSEGTVGTAQIVKLDDASYVVRLGKDFAYHAGAPDVTIGLGNNGYIENSNLGPLKASKGAQDFALPAGFDPAKINQVFVWCRQFQVSLGVARLN